MHHMRIGRFSLFVILLLGMVLVFSACGGQSGEEENDTKGMWFVDFLKPSGRNIHLVSTMEQTDNAMQWLYTGEGVNYFAHWKYCWRLKKAGYTVLSTNRIEGSFFTTLVNPTEGVALYVAYNAYSHKDECTPPKNGHQEEFQYEKCLRIVSTLLEDVTLPDDTLLLPDTDYQKVTDSMVTTTPLYLYAVGLSYIVTLEDGRFVVFDGGGVNSSQQEHHTLWNALKQLHTNIYGAEPTPSSPIHIAAWILTHNHWDHSYAFQSMLEAYGQSGLLKMDYMFANLPSESGMESGFEDLYTVNRETIENMISQVPGGFSYVTVHTGDVYYLANLEMEILATWEDLNPVRAYHSNDTNTVVRFTLKNKDNPHLKITQMWLGDAYDLQSNFLCAMYGDYLQSDMTSVAHHGNVGCEKELYDLIQPTAVWWPNTAQSIAQYLDPANAGKGVAYEVDQHLAYDIESVKYIYAAGNTKTNAPNDAGDHTTLVLTKDGPDYEGIFDLCTGQPISYSSIGAFLDQEDGVAICK